MSDVRILEGDALAVLATLESVSLDALVTDPPAGIGFMGKEWDDYRRSRNPADAGRNDPFGRTSRRGPEYGRAKAGFLFALTPIFAECLRVLKPGAHGLVWAIPRTSHWTATALEDAGFEVRDVIVHLFGSGFPKSLDVSKAIDKAAGAERPVVERRSGPRPGTHGGSGQYGHGTDRSLTAPATLEAERWQGWGTALKPAAEHWILVRSPLSERNVAANVLRHGTGALNVDGCRVGDGPSPSVDRRAAGAPTSCRPGEYGDTIVNRTTPERYEEPRGGEHVGRWPANVAFTHAEDCGDECAPGCPVAELDRQSGETESVNRTRRNSAEGMGFGGARRGFETASYEDTGGASRFYYTAKPAGSERDLGLGRVSGSDRNVHPTVKAVDLMRYLCRLVTPPRGVVLDPFMGSGSTGIAALREGFGFVGIERDPAYFDIAKRRIVGDAPLLNAGAVA